MGVLGEVVICSNPKEWSISNDSVWGGFKKWYFWVVPNPPPPLPSCGQSTTLFCGKICFCSESPDTEK